MRRTLRLALAVACAALLTPAAAHAATPGVNIAGAPTPDKVATALSTGAKQIRMFVIWNTLEPGSAADFPNPSDVNLQNLDRSYRDAVSQINAAGAKPLFVIIGAPGWAGGGSTSSPPSDPQAYADFVGQFAAAMTAGGGQLAGIEVWNEPDESAFWNSPDPAAYTRLLKASYASIKAAAPSVPVITGATTGNNYDWVTALYNAGAAGSFDAVAVHTDTACLVNGPDDYYRNSPSDPRLARFTFLAYREVRNVMVAHGDAGKPIMMTELGWSTGGGQCQRGDSAGKKAAGVSPAQQAQFLTQAYGCLAADPYVASADWFTLADDPNQSVPELGGYGLLGKPSLAAFQAVAAANGGPPRSCGDFGGPDLNVISPVEGQKYSDTLELKARAVDPNDVESIAFYADGQKIGGTFQDDAQLKAGPVGLPQWNGARDLSIGAHVIKVVAIDKLGNETTKTVNIQHVTAAQAGPGTLTGSFAKLGRKSLKCKGRTCTFKGKLAKPAGTSAAIPGKVAVQWQFKNKKGKWRKLVGGLKPANGTFTFKAKLKFKGAWRVRVTYAGVAPYKKATSKWVTFRVK